MTNETTSPIEEFMESETGKELLELTPDKANRIIARNTDHFDDDYLYTRDELKNLVAEGREAIDEFKEICMETGEPRAFEVLGQLIKNTASIAEAVMVNAKNKSSINKEMGIIKKFDGSIDEDGNKTTNNINNQTIFVGTTKDLQKIINSIDDENDVIDVTQESKEII